MQKAAKKSSHEPPVHLPEEDDTLESQEDGPSSEQEPDAEVSLHPAQAPYAAYSAPQVVPSMFMPYIEGPHMDWTVNDGIYHRFLKWHLKCENILECELAALHEKQASGKATEV